MSQVEKAEFRAPRAASWPGQCGVVALSGGVALLIALVAFQFQQLGVAPAVLFPLAVGAAAGAGLCFAEHVVGIQLNRARWLVAATCALVAVVGQEAIGYVTIQRPQEAARLADPRLELFREGGFAREPTSFGEFLTSRVRQEPLWWTVDLTLALTGSIVASFFGRRPRSISLDDFSTDPTTTKT